jgi:hypothetical protein
MEQVGKQGERKKSGLRLATSAGPTASQEPAQLHHAASAGPMRWRVHQRDQDSGGPCPQGTALNHIGSRSPRALQMQLTRSACLQKFPLKHYFFQCHQRIAVDNSAVQREIVDKLSGVWIPLRPGHRNGASTYTHNVESRPSSTISCGYRAHAANKKYNPMKDIYKKILSVLMPSHWTMCGNSDPDQTADISTKLSTEIEASY